MYLAYDLKANLNQCLFFVKKEEKKLTPMIN